MKQIVVPATKFKAECLRLLDEAGAGTRIIVTKRGKAIARVLPAEKPQKLGGSWVGMTHEVGEIILDTSGVWDTSGK